MQKSFPSWKLKFFAPTFKVDILKKLLLVISYHIPYEDDDGCGEGSEAGLFGIDKHGDDVLPAVGLAPDHKDGEQEYQVDENDPPRAADHVVQEVHDEDAQFRGQRETKNQTQETTDES